jgi:hypothetical protein
MSSYFRMLATSITTQAFSRSIYKVSLYPYWRNTHNNVPYSYEFAVYFVIFGALLDISVMEKAFSKRFIKYQLVSLLISRLSYSMNTVYLSEARTNVTLASASSLNIGSFFGVTHCRSIPHRL